VWLAVLAATKEAVGTHHLDLFRRAGGADAQAGAAFQLAAYAGAADTFAFVEKEWSDFYPDLDARAAYRDGAAALLRDRVPPELACLALAAVHAVHGSHWGVAVEIEGAYASGIPEEKLVEALGLIIWPVGVNKFLDACTIWHDLMGAGRVRPSPRFQAWADTPAQGRFEPQ
jgi:alkylhydroperoxidase/carboxymuconolactone decarboxylase family protein YurZ